MSTCETAATATHLVADKLQTTASRAVVFTHHAIKPNQFDTPDNRRQWWEDTEKVFDGYLASKSVGLFFVYISMGIENVVLKLKSGGRKFEIPMELLEQEERIRNVFRIALDQAAARRQSGPTTDVPRVVLVGLFELASILNKLMGIDPRLVKNIAGRGGSVFTYDAPKFVEAIIRIRRGQQQRCSPYPILRIDADVTINDDAIQKILAQVRLMEEGNATNYYFFSGCYKGATKCDPINEHAVRTHWLYDFGTNSVPPGVSTFLRDMEELGARQIDSSIHPSAPCDALMKIRKGKKARPSNQVISGAGLVMSLMSILRLPPDMNAENMIVWIDDYLRRLLHEAIGDLATGDVERVDAARFEQIRHPNGILPGDIRWAERFYFERLLRGCLLDAAIKEWTGQAGPLAKAIKKAISSGSVKLPASHERDLRKEIDGTIRKRFRETMDIWKVASYGNTVLNDWARNNDNASFEDQICNSTVSDSIGYLKLVLDWRLYVDAIERLDPPDAYWIFSPIR